jgi:hypothetical protein
LRAILRLRFFPALLSLLATAEAVAAAPAWKVDREVDGMKLEVREVKGSHYEELRVTTASPLPLDALCNAVWGKNAEVKDDFKQRVIISETETERWTYEQIRLPVVSDRDCVMRVRLLTPASTGRCEVDFVTMPHADYPVAKGHERVVVRGFWDLAPGADGKVKVTYVVYSEPGGAIPPVFAKGGQRDAAVKFMKQILGRASPK